MGKEPKPNPSSNIELEKMRTELEKRKVESSENLQKRWQGVINSITDGIKRSWKHGKEVESCFSQNVLILVLVLFGGVGLLTYLEIIPDRFLLFRRNYSWIFALYYPSSPRKAKRFLMIN